MKKQLKCLEDTIVELEKEIKQNPNPFLISTLERFKVYRTFELERLVDQFQLNDVKSK